MSDDHSADHDNREPSNNGDGETDARKPGEEFRPPIVNVAISGYPAENQRASQEQDKQGRREIFRKRYTTVIATIAALGALGAAIYAKVASEAAWQQVEITDDTAKKQLRAYVAVEPGPAPTLANGIITELPLKFTNSGQTPAYKMAFAAKIFEEVEEKAMSWAWTFPTQREKYKSKVGFLPTSTIRTFPVSGGINPATVKKIGRLIYAVGIVFYDDIYKTTHWTTFCIWWSGDSLKPEDATYCDKYNETGTGTEVPAIVVR